MRGDTFLSYSIGVDFGTESGRVLLLDLVSGQEMAVSVIPYSNGVIDAVLPNTAERLPPDWALQDPLDYIQVLEIGIPSVLEQVKVSADAVIGIGIDFTSCTVLPVNEAGVPLCATDNWSHHPHSWPKLWKHHAAQHYADVMNEMAIKNDETFISRYGGKISSEWYFPKLLEIFRDDREVYDATYAFIEATDWVVWYLTGTLMKNSCTAGYKAMWSEDGGYPSKEFFTGIDSEFVNPFEKLGEIFFPLGTRAGYVREDLAIKLGLTSHTAVAVGNVDAHVSVPGAGVSEAGSLVMVMGTSICHLTVNQKEVFLSGITGVVKNGILPDLFGYEAGQAAVGDMFAWFVKQSVPQEYFYTAKNNQQTIYELLESLASNINPGATGLMALDWWNGNRSILGDANLSGLIAGITLASRPEEIYRSLLESTAFGTRIIIENFIKNGVSIHKLVACGGISIKSSLLMQIYADVCGLPVHVMNSTEIPARGSALFGAVAAGRSAGGFISIEEASVTLAPPIYKIYIPIPSHEIIYDQLFKIYKRLYEYFGSSEADLMHELKEIRIENLR